MESPTTTILSFSLPPFSIAHARTPPFLYSDRLLSPPLPPNLSLSLSTRSRSRSRYNGLHRSLRALPLRGGSPRTISGAFFFKFSILDLFPQCLVCWFVLSRCSESGPKSCDFVDDRSPKEWRRPSFAQGKGSLFSFFLFHLIRFLAIGMAFSFSRVSFRCCFVCVYMDFLINCF